MGPLGLLLRNKGLHSHFLVFLLGFGWVQRFVNAAGKNCKLREERTVAKSWWKSLLSTRKPSLRLSSYAAEVDAERGRSARRASVLNDHNTRGTDQH